MAVQSSALSMALPVTQGLAWRKRTLTILLMAVIASIFWVDSRYPALMKRYHAGTQIKATGALTFGTVYTVEPSMPYATRVWRTTVNWLDANRVGMTFSFLFGPAALIFLSTLRRRRTNSRYLNTLMGMVAGVPLGVCSNCIAPIARGFYASGMSSESVLAAMFASPALNLVVLAMTFTLFPLSLAYQPFLRKEFLERIPRSVSADDPRSGVGRCGDRAYPAAIAGTPGECYRDRGGGADFRIPAGADGFRCGHRLHRDGSRRATAVCGRDSLYPGDYQCVFTFGDG